jgi:hypothetical protein
VTTSTDAFGQSVYVSQRPVVVLLSIAASASSGLLACSADRDSADPVAGSTTGGEVADIANPGEREWVAVYAIEPSESSERDEFIAAAGSQVSESPAGCWEEMSARLEVPPEVYVLGVVAPTEERITELIGRLHGNPLVRGEFVRVCPND